MKANDFREAVVRGLAGIEENKGVLESLTSDKMCRGNVFNYAAWCERNFELNLREDYKRKTTFTSDFSIAEWCAEHEGVEAVLDTFKRAVIEWKDDIIFFAELIIAMNMKSWEHASRKNNEWSKLYAELYYLAKDLFFEWYDDENEKSSEAIQYYYDYVD